MKKLLYFTVLVAMLAACRSSKNYLERSDEDKALQDAIKRLDKKPGDEDAAAAIPILYSNIKNAHLANIRTASASKEIGKWDRLVGEYEKLQNAYNSIINSTPAYKLVNPQSYSTELMETKDTAAAEYFKAGEDFLVKNNRADAKKAYNYFKKADKYVPGFKNAQQKMDEAYEMAVVDVVINPVQDNSFFFNSGWGNSAYNYSNEYFQQTLVRDLQNVNNSQRYAARFYTDWQARRDNVQPDWVVDLTLRNMNIPYPSTYTYRRNASQRVEVGRDTANRPIYQTVYATVNITRRSFTANADMEVRIKDVQTGKNISYRSFNEDYRWQEEYGSYNGDSRALSASDWNIINNNRYQNNDPRREDIMGELYRKIYPQVLNNIKYAADW